MNVPTKYIKVGINLISIAGSCKLNEEGSSYKNFLDYTRHIIIFQESKNYCFISLLCLESDLNMSETVRYNFAHIVVQFQMMIIIWAYLFIPLIESLSKNSLLEWCDWFVQ